MKLLELYQRLDELRVRYRSSGDHDRYDVVAHRGNVWMVGNNDQDAEQVAQDIHQQSGGPNPEESSHISFEERPDIISATYEPDSQSLWMSDSEMGHHPRASAELKKLAKLLGVDSIGGSRFLGMDDQEVQHYNHEMEGQVPDELYHGTDVNALPDILRLGLIPARGDANWDNVGQFDLVFLAADWHKAAFHAVRQGQEGRGAPVILKVKIPDRSKIEPDFDAMVTLGADDDERADSLGYSGANGYQPEWGSQNREDIAKYNTGSDNLPLISGVIGYSGRIPPSHILNVEVDLRGEMGGDADEPEFTSFDMPGEIDELRDALSIFNDYGYWYPGIRDEMEDEEDEGMYEDDSDHAEALQQTGFWGRAGAGVLFLARDTGRILIAHRSADVEQPDTWGTWGGAIDRKSVV